MVKAGNNSVVEGDYSTYDGLTVGMLEGNSKNGNFERFAEEHSFSFTPVYFADQNALTEALQNGEVDAAVTGSLRLLENEWLLSLPDAVDAPVRAGQVVGTLRFLRDGEPVASVPVCASSDVEKIGFGTLLGRILTNIFGVW